MESNYLIAKKQDPIESRDIESVQISKWTIDRAWDAWSQSKSLNGSETNSYLVAPVQYQSLVLNIIDVKDEPAF